MKIFKWISNNLLFIFTLVLLAFIPLYPKIPLVDVKNTWVYVRVEDLLVVVTLAVWSILLFLKKFTLKTPLTIPILVFWLVGGISTLHGVLLIFPTLSDIFSNVALLSMLRRIEYLSLFFVAFMAIRDKKAIYYVIWSLSIILLLIIGYGFGQRFLMFPAYLTMNEEVAKGVPVHLSELARIPSTFAGHYDLAAYLVLVIPIMVSLIFGFKNIFAKLFFIGTSLLGFMLLFMTVSRVSFFVLLASLMLLLIFQQKKWFIGLFLVLMLVFLSFAPSLVQRFGDTLKEVNVLVDSDTGRAIGEVREVPAAFFEGKIVRRQLVSAKDDRIATGSASLAFSKIPDPSELLVESNSPTGENLPQGTGYINLALSPVIKSADQYFFQKATDSPSEEPWFLAISGNYLIKRAVAYDLSFTTRFQGEWPRTFAAFERNIFLGSGYGSVSLAVDNDYLRILGESGLFGLFAFFSIFVIAGIYIKKLLPRVESPVVRSFILGFVAGTFGLMLNATLIDVFEASKVAFTLWLLMGIVLGTLFMYKTFDIDIVKEYWKVLTSNVAIVIYLITTAIALYMVAAYFFVGDDFTWFRWVTNPSSNILDFFIDSSGFFYRPGTKLFFSLMYPVFWLNHVAYHIVSIVLHAGVAVLIFFISKRILKNFYLSFLTAFIFLVLTGYHEAVFWISAIGFLFTAFFILAGLLSFIFYREKQKIIYLIISFISLSFSLLFHELGVVAPLLIILYDFIFVKKAEDRFFKKEYLILFFPILPYFLFRFLSHSHWLNGDYSYSLINLPFNIIGNTLGYFTLGFFGPQTLSFYEAFRGFSRSHILFASIASVIGILLLMLLIRLFVKKVSRPHKRILIFAFLFFFISLLPFLGLGNIASRYSYLSSFGIAVILAMIFKTIYNYLLSNGRNIAVLTIAIIFIVFVSFQLFESQKIHNDWREAGEKSRKFFLMLDKVYQEKWKYQKTNMYFVDVPIKFGEAWVFPVGLPDAVWFAYKNNNISVYSENSIEDALEKANPTTDEIYQFKNNNIYEIKKGKNEILINKVQ